MEDFDYKDLSHRLKYRLYIEREMAQTVHFFHLQLQFLSMGPTELIQLARLVYDNKVAKVGLDTYLHYPMIDKSAELATELALYFSGLEQ
jgi:hypothetical protein